MRIPNRGPLRLGQPATVYFIRRGAYMKIGISRHPIIRARRLRIPSVAKAPQCDGSPMPTQIVFTIPGSTLDDEKAMHRRFAEWHVAGEWFYPNVAFAAELAALQREVAAKAAAADEAVLTILHNAVTTQEA